MKDYSQEGEQAAILEALGFPPKEANWRPPAGRFLEIGAWDAFTFSNTRALYELGWAGVLVEPSPGPMLKLLAEYGDNERIALVQAAVSPHGSRCIQMHVTDDGVSTADPAIYATWKQATRYRGALLVPVITLEDISLQFGHFDFWSIDAEGLSAEIFMRMLALGYRPKAICVEHDKREGELMQVAGRAHYSCVLANATNLVFRNDA